MKVILNILIAVVIASQAGAAFACSCRRAPLDSVYKDSNHVVRHNTVVKKLEDIYAKQIYLAELGREVPGKENLSVRWLRTQVSKWITDAEFIEQHLLKDPHAEIGLLALKQIRTKNHFDLLKRVASGEYPESFKKMSKEKIRRVKNSLRFILA